MRRARRRSRFGRAYARERFVVQVRYLSKWETPYSVALERQIDPIMAEIRQDRPRAEVRVVDTTTGLIVRHEDGLSPNEGTW